jgi:hypothetical protein
MEQTAGVKGISFFICKDIPNTNQCPIAMMIQTNGETYFSK